MALILLRTQCEDVLISYQEPLYLSEDCSEHDRDLQLLLDKAIDIELFERSLQSLLLNQLLFALAKASTEDLSSLHVLSCSDTFQD